MANNKKVMDSIKDFLERMKACDEAIPEDLAEDALEMVEGVKDALCEDEDVDVLEVTKDADPDGDDKDIDRKVEDAISRVLKKYGMIKDNSMSSIDEALEEEVKQTDACPDGDNIVTDEDNEESVTVDPEKIKSEDSIREYVRAIKPLIAKMPNARDRKRASDAVAGMIRMSRGNVYGDILNASRKAADSAINDKKAKGSVVDSDLDLGKKWAQQFNPHYNKEVK